MKRATGAWLAGAALASLLVTRVLIRRARAFDLGGKVVMITGGSRGLGLAIARAAAARGAKLVLLARDVSELGHAREELRGRGAEVLALGCDVTKRDEVRRAAVLAAQWFGQIDVLINDAGVIEVGPVGEMAEADFERAMATHFHGPLHFVYEVAPRMIHAGGGRIVNIASIGGLMAVPHLAPYCASKFALVGLSQALRAELAKDGVVVTTVCPGLMRTGSGRAVLLKGDVEKESAWFRASALAPLLSMSAEAAAEKVLRACEHGDGLVVLGAPAKLAALAAGLMPNVLGGLLGLVARALPGAPAASAPDGVRGAEVALRPSWLQRIEDEYAMANNELGVARGTDGGGDGE